VEGHTLLSSRGEYARGPWLHNGTIHRIRSDRDGDRVLAASFDNSASLWDLRTEPPRRVKFEHSAAVQSVAFQPGGDRVAIACDDNMARILRPAIGPSVRVTRHDLGIGDAATEQDAVYSVGGRYVLYRSNADQVVVADAESRRHVALLRHAGPIRAFAVSDDQTRVFVGTPQNTSQLFDATTGDPLLPPFRHPGGLWFVAISPNGHHLLAGCYAGSLQLRDATTGSIRWERPNPDARILGGAFSPDGSRFVVLASDRVVRVYRTDDPSLVTSLRGHDSSPVAAAFSPDGELLATAGHDNTVRVWRVDTGETVGEPMRHPGPIWHPANLAFSPDGKTVVSGCDDRCARLWDVATSLPIGPPLRHDKGIRMVTFSHLSGVCTGTTDGTVRDWIVRPTPMKGSVERIRTWVEVRTGMQMDRAGDIRRIDRTTWQRLNTALVRLGGDPISR